MLPILGWLFWTARAERYGLIIISVLVGHTAWHWIMERYDALRQTPLPDLDEMTGQGLLGGMLVVVVSIAALWLAWRWLVYRQGDA